MRLRQQRGSAMVMSILLSVVITATVMMLALTTTAQLQEVSAYSRVDKSFSAAEGGLNTVAWRIKHSEIASLTSLNGTLGDGSYSATWTLLSNGTYAVQSVGKYLATTSTVKAVCTPPTSTAISVGGSMTVAACSVQGDVIVIGGVTHSGPATQLLTSIQGKLSSAGPITMLAANGNTSLNLLSIPIAFASNGFYANQTGLTPTSASAYYTAQAARKGPDVTSIGLLTTVDIANSYNGCFRVGGNATIVLAATFKGPGTVVIDGDLTGVSATFGSASAPVNVVCSGNCTLVASTIYGSLYVCKNISPLALGCLTVNGGAICVDGNLSLGLLSSLQVLNAPTAPLQMQSFDHDE